jgi:hypothetical protein
MTMLQACWVISPLNHIRYTSRRGGFENRFSNLFHVLRASHGVGGFKITLQPLSLKTTLYTNSLTLKKIQVGIQPVYSS